MTLAARDVIWKTGVLPVPLISLYFARQKRQELSPVEISASLWGGLLPVCRPLEG